MILRAARGSGLQVGVRCHVSFESHSHGTAQHRCRDQCADVGIAGHGQLYDAGADSHGDHAGDHEIEVH